MRHINRTGGLDWNREEEVEKGEDWVTVVTPLLVEWSCEIGEYGDGSEYVDFEAWATTEDGTEVELSQAEQDNIYTQLHSEGAFA